MIQFTNCLSTSAYPMFIKSPQNRGCYSVALNQKDMLQQVILRCFDKQEALGQFCSRLQNNFRILQARKLHRLTLLTQPWQYTSALTYNLLSRCLHGMRIPCHRWYDTIQIYRVLLRHVLMPARYEKLFISRSQSSSVIPSKLCFISKFHKT